MLVLFQLCPKLTCKLAAKEAFLQLQQRPSTASAGHQHC